MNFFSKKTKDPVVDDAQSAETLKTLYKQNLELAVKNKTLSLLRKLYDISILTLEPKALAEKTTELIQKDLSFELVGILLYDQTSDELRPLAFAGSERINHANGGLLGFHAALLTSTKENAFFKSILENKTPNHTENINDIWGKALSESSLQKISENAHIKSSLVHPLIQGNTIMGVLVISLNRKYEDMLEYEKESIYNFANVITVAIDKAVIYKQLKITNTELEQANVRLKELDQQKTEFISLASHQLRGPLGAIKGYTSLVLEGDYGPFSDSVKKALETIYKSTQAMVVLVADYLDVSRIEQGKMKYDFSDFDMKELLQTIIDEFKPTIESAGLGFEYACDTTKKYMVHADMGKIKQVLLNLVDNSIKYTPKGNIKIKLEKDDVQKKILFTISDTGFGILPEVLPRLFEKFIRSPDASKVNIMGTGLGLFVAKKMVEAHKGNIWAESPGRDKGATFHVELWAV